MTHTIRQQYVHVEVEETEADGLSLQRRLPALCLESLLPAFEQVFNRYTSSDRHLSIERLEIDAGAIPSHEWSMSWLRQRRWPLNGR